jgi:hypothetical protein
MVQSIPQKPTAQATKPAASNQNLPPPTNVIISPENILQSVSPPKQDEEALSIPPVFPAYPDELLNIYYSRTGPTNYILKNGSKIFFANGQYATANPVEVAQLDSEVREPGSGIFVDPAKKQISKSELSPIEAARKQAVLDYIERVKAANRGESGSSTYARTLVLQGAVSSSEMLAQQSESMAPNAKAE